MIKGWWEGGTVIVWGGDVERQIAVARADERWVLVGISVPSVVGTGWEGRASEVRNKSAQLRPIISQSI
jgi:hypothetical protein